MYRMWPASIDGVEICALQLPARENRTREPHFETYEQLADLIAADLPPYLDRPYAFFGHCGGALPAFETTLRLAEQGAQAPVRLFISSQVAPHDGPHGRFLGLTRDELADEIRKLLVATGAQPIAELVELWVDVLVADVEASKRYAKPAPVPLPCPTTAFGWTRDCEVDPTLMGGWKDCGPTRYVLLEGEHYTFLSAPGDLLAELGNDMEEALTAGAARLI
jgi:surfactin synthase thioesterase subunit